jgi:DNA-directed RNA polymerase subunit RPC12/RpoP
MASTPDPDSDPCFICLEESTAESTVQTLNFGFYREIPCSCQVACHIQCWTAYYTQKGGFECPICHSKVVIAPHPPRPQPPQLPIRRERMIIVVRQASDEVHEYRCSVRERVSFIFCILLLAISMIVILIIRIK